MKYNPTPLPKPPEEAPEAKKIYIEALEMDVTVHKRAISFCKSSELRERLKDKLIRIQEEILRLSKDNGVQ